jgi:inner membrane protein
VRFFQPNDFYAQAYRAARYGILFIALTFLTVLLIENRTGRPTHPVQYILIGLAQSVFVLLMVSYAEQIGFGAAYALSAGATTVLLTLFGWAGLKLERRSLVLGIMLAVTYGVLYLILRSADYALLAGSTLAFLALALTMFMTRNEDWYGPEGPGKAVFGGLRQPAPGAAAGVVTQGAQGGASDGAGPP